MPAVNGDGVAGFFVIVGKDRRKLLERDVGGKFVVTIVEPGFWIERSVVACANGIIPAPGTELTVRGMPGKQSFRGALGVAFGLLEHGELIRVDRLVFVNTGLHVPASEVTTKGSRKCSGAETTNGCALPEAVVDVSAVERSFLCAGIFKRFADRALPCRSRDFIVG